MERNLVSALFGIVMLAFTASCKCDNSAFTGSSKVRKKGQDLTATAAVSRSLDTVTSHKIWVAAKTEAIVAVSRLTVEGNEVKQTKKWTGLVGSGGTRTYVTEAGFLAARSPHIYFIDPEKTPEGPITPSHSIAGATNSHRICLASYKRNNKRFMLAAWGPGMYREFPMEDTPPYKPIWNQPSASGQINIPNATWGYSCFIDQKRLIFYSQYYQGTVVGALKLDPIGQVEPADVAPNGQFTSDTPELKPFTLGPKAGSGQSYSMSGDNNGNVLNGGAYTMAHDPNTNTVWISNQSAVWVVPGECLTTEKNCTGHRKYASPVGPLSALKDGRIVGMTRATGEIYLLSLKNPADRTAGIDSTLIANVNSDPYMYTDFTGATLYVTNAEQTINLEEQLNFNKDKNVKALQFSWIEKSGTSDQWQSLKLEMRCYLRSATKPDYQEVSGVGPSKARIKAGIDQCTNKKFDTVDVKVSQLNSADTMMGIDKVEVTAEQ